MLIRSAVLIGGGKTRIRKIRGYLQRTRRHIKGAAALSVLGLVGPRFARPAARSA